eukprot:323594-Chlamydomonas_euryale.AAC.1
MSIRKTPHLPEVPFTQLSAACSPCPHPSTHTHTALTCIEFMPQPLSSHLHGFSNAPSASHLSFAFPALPP